MDTPRVVQARIAAQAGAELIVTLPEQIVGVADNLRSGVWPLNGLRHPPTGTTSGWYLWAGAGLSDAPDYFKPTHASHLQDLCPEILPYLGLGPGWRFLLGERGYSDIWYDGKLFVE